MAPERLRSIVPMFGGATSYVDTLDSILEFVDAYQPTPDELIGWHRGNFDGVSSRNSIQRRVDYLHNVGFLEWDGERWTLGPEGEKYAYSWSTDVLLEIMCRRNVGLRSLLYALSAGPMTADEIGRQQLATHPELGWNPENVDMALQRINWLRSLGLIQKDGDSYALSEEGRQFTEYAVEEWADTTERSASTDDESFVARSYDTVVTARSVDAEFRLTALTWYDSTCPVSGVDRPQLLDVAHVLRWSDFPEHRADLTNVLPLSKTHHAAFDRAFFTIDEEYRLRANPTFETDSDLLQRTILEQDGERLSIPKNRLNHAYLRQHNAALEWV